MEVCFTKNGENNLVKICSLCEPLDKYIYPFADKNGEIGYKQLYNGTVLYLKQTIA